MLSQEELLDGINQLINGPHTVQNCEKLAAVFTVLDHLYPEDKEPEAVVSYSAKDESTEIGTYGDSEFLTAISNKRPEAVWALLDELMSTIKVLYPKLYNNVIVKIMDL